MSKTALWAAWAAVGSAATALAADANGDGYAAVCPPVQPPIDWWTLLYFVVACLGIAVVAFKSARRTHLD